MNWVENCAADATDAATKAIVDGRMNSCGSGLNAACAAVASGELPQQGWLTESHDHLLC